MISMLRKEACAGSVNGLIYLVQNIHAHKGEGCFLPECRQKFFRTSSPRRTISGDVCGNSTYRAAIGTEYVWAQESRCCENNVCFRRFTHPISLVSDIDSCESVVLVLCSHAPPSSSFVTVALLIPHCVVKSDRWSLDDDQLLEDCYYEALALSRHSINLELDEENMKTEKATKPPENRGMDPGTVKMKKWYQGQTRESDESQCQSPSDRASDTEAPTGTDRTSYQAPEPIEDDEERLAMRQGDMPPPSSTWASCHSENSTRTSSTGSSLELGQGTVPPSKTLTRYKCWPLQRVNVPVQHPFSTTWVPSIRNNGFQKVENMDKSVTSGEKFNVTNEPQLSFLREIWRKTARMWPWRQRLTACQQMKRSCLMTVACGMSSRSNDLSAHARIDSSECVRLIWEFNDDKNGHSAIFEVTFGKKTEVVTTESREWSAEQLFGTLELVALAVEGSVLTEDTFEPTAPLGKQASY